MNRRQFILGLGAGAMLAGGQTQALEIINHCRAHLPDDLRIAALLQQTWAGLNPAEVWDMHVHIAGTGDSGQGIEIAPQMKSVLYPKQFAKRLFLMNAGCARNDNSSVDQAYVDRMLNLCDAAPEGFKVLLLAVDRPYARDGEVLDCPATLYVSNAYAQKLASAHPDRFAWACSVHPFRHDAVTVLEQAVATGACAVKWLPAAMNFNPADPQCDAFYAALARLGIPLLTHTGEEKAIDGAGTHDWYNPLLLRRALDRGVKVICAHCATSGEALDLDRKTPIKVPAFDLFARMMDDPAYQNLLYGDVSAIVLRNRAPEVIRVLLERQEWHERLLYGSDYPLPGVLPLVWLKWLVKERLLAEETAATLKTMRQANPLLFHLALLRALRSRGRGFATSVFQTRRIFIREKTHG